ncbi:MAG: DNA mismatch repair endonuclease MutL [bacterium]
MIRVLPESLVNKIAAGEVIVRPASVVKELVENAIDAGAQRIRVELGNDCRDIRVSDDGCGMDRDEAALAFVRHATSKISEFEDLWSLTTRGFRGEALASVAAVARVEILTRRRGSVAGTRIRAEGAGEPFVEPAGAPEGTDVRVRDLFFNTPARLKFMKSAASELHQAMTVFTRQTLIEPEIAFTFTAGKSALVDLPARQPWEERITMLLGSQIAGNLLAVNAGRHGAAVRGFVVRPSVTRKDRAHQFFFVNGRPIVSRQLSFMLQEACKGLVMTRRFPVAVLDVVVPAGEVDVNVHPTKDEVRFRNENMISGLAHRAIRETLAAANLMPAIEFDGDDSAGERGVQPPLPPGAPPMRDSRSANVIPVDFSMFTQSLQPPLAGREASSGAAKQFPEFRHPDFPSSSSVDNAPADETGTIPAADADDHTAPMPFAVMPEPLGQIAQCYIVARCGDDLLLIDQHAAHERLIHARLSRGQISPNAQPLLIPVSVDVPAPALAFMNKLLPELAELGLNVEPFGGQTFLVHSIPADLPSLDAAAVISDLIEDCETFGKSADAAELRDRVITRMACRSAIKAGQQLQPPEMRALIRDLGGAQLGFTCPHGRPTMIMLTRDQLDRQFKRKA